MNSRVNYNNKQYIYNHVNIRINIIFFEFLAIKTQKFENIFYTPMQLQENTLTVFRMLKSCLEIERHVLGSGS